MKTLILLFPLFCLCIYAQSDTSLKTFKIKSDRNAYLVYSSEGELLYEFTPRNTDSLNLKTLDSIYFGLEIDDSFIRSSNNNLKIEVVKVPDDTWSDILKILIPSIIAVLFAWSLSFIPQRNQVFQSAFFQLLNNQQELLKSVSFKVGRLGTIQEFTGTRFFLYAHRKLSDLYEFISTEYETDETDTKNNADIQMNNKAFALSNDLMEQEELKEYYNKRPLIENYYISGATKSKITLVFELQKALYVYDYFYEKHSNYMQHYFRYLYYTLKYIDDSKFIINKKYYTGLVHAQMSDSELYVLFYHGLKDSKILTFIKKYKIVENLYADDLMNTIHQVFYKVKLKRKFLGS